MKHLILNKRDQKSRRLSVLPLFAALALLATGCSRAEFSMYDDGKFKSAGLQENPPDAVVCDPFNSGNNISATLGLKGSIHYAESLTSRPSSSTDLIRDGKKLDAELFLSRLFVPTRMFDSGFVAEGGRALQNEKGEVLTEWFALDMQSKIKLAAGEATGLYQLAVLSDDGATLLLNNPATGAFEPLIQSEGAHETKLACAGQVVEMGASTKIPMRLTYFQGPRFHISLVLMWRKVSGSMASIAESECGKLGTEYFFTPGTATKAAIPKAPYQGLLARGWKPLNAENFELVSGSNRCVK